jgi:hypothetical protein
MMVVCHRQAALGHHLHQVSQRQLESKIPAHAQDNDSAVDLAPLDGSSAIFSSLTADLNQFSWSA